MKQPLRRMRFVSQIVVTSYDLGTELWFFFQGVGVEWGQWGGFFWKKWQLLTNLYDSPLAMCWQAQWPYREAMELRCFEVSWMRKIHATPGGGKKGLKMNLGFNSQRDACLLDVADLLIAKILQSLDLKMDSSRWAFERSWYAVRWWMVRFAPGFGSINLLFVCADVKLKKNEKFWVGG